ncbi:phospholipid carrier-dependent glycosyltransferase [Patescibacteria group bacterium]|nr:phospholipid carrier-dependent glycosyltransferase [Patescibacteria group bacterium]
MTNPDIRKFFILSILLFIALIGSIPRLYHLTEVPAGLMQDEAIAYDAYSVMKTGRDHHGVYFPITFQSFNDYIGHITSYTLIPFIAVWGLTPLALRLSVAILSILTIPLIFLLVKKLTYDNTLSLMTAFILTVSQFAVSSARWLISPNVVPFYITSALLLFFVAIGSSKHQLIKSIIAGVSSGICLYIYPSMEGMLPVWLIILLVITILWKKRVDKDTVKKLLIISSSAFIIYLPLLREHLLRPQTITNRLNMVSVSSVHGNYLFTYFTHYLSYFPPSPLFWRGETNPTRTVSGFGYENTALGLFFYLGLFILFFKKKFIEKKYASFSGFKLLTIQLFVILFPIVPALTLPAGDFQRATHFLPIMVFLISLGIIYTWEMLNKFILKSNVYLFTIIILSFVALFAYQQYNFYLTYFGSYYRGITQWYFQYGMDKVIAFTSENERKYKNIIIDNTINQPYIYVLFYKKVDPKTLTEQDYKDFSHVDPTTNWLAVSKFRNYGFRKITSENMQGAKLLKTVYNSPYSQYGIYTKGGNLIVRFEVINSNVTVSNALISEANSVKI